MNADKAWSSAPIILKDGHETDPAEVKVIRGYGYVEDIDEKPSGAMKVSFMAHDKNGNPREHLPSAWISGAETEMVKLVQASNSKKRNIYYRIEIRRKDGIDRKLPIEELSTLAMAGKSIHRSLASLKVRADDEWMFTKSALTNPLEEPSDERFPSAVGKAPRNANGSSAANVAGTVVNAHPVEPPKEVTFTESGDVNPGSIAAAAPLAAYSLATKVSRGYGLELSKKRLGTLAASILRMAGNLQVEIWDGKLSKPDFRLGSFDNAHRLIEEIILSAEPISEDTFEDDEFKEWQSRVESESLKLWRWSHKMVEKTKDDDESKG